MTKEEIEKLPGIVDTILDESVTAHVSEKMHEKITEVCNLAIEALSAEPCEDAISRAWIKEAIHNLYHYSMHTPTEEDIQEYIVDDALPVTPKQKMGRWIEHEHNGIAYIECSKCLTWFLRAYLTRNSYCPNCGAKMGWQEGRAE